MGLFITLCLYKTNVINPFHSLKKRKKKKVGAWECKQMAEGNLFSGTTQRTGSVKGVGKITYFKEQHFCARVN